MNSKEELRLKVLNDYHILDTLPEKEYDAITRLASYICQTPMALISLVDDKRQWFKSKIGLDVNETPKSISFCQHAIQQNSLYEVNNADKTELYKDNPLVTGIPNIRFYAGVPLSSPGGQNLGTLCVLDTVSRELSDDQKDALNILANEVITHLETRKKNRLLIGAISKYNDIESMFSNSGELHCILNDKGEIEYINHSVKNILGYNGRDVIGWPIWKFLVQDDLPEMIKRIEQDLKDGKKYFEIENRTITKSGDVRWMSWFINVKKRRWYVNGRDFTDAKRNAEQLRQLSLVASKVNNGVVISDSDNKVTWINEAFEKITGYNLADVEGKRLGDVIMADDTDLVALQEARDLTNEKKSFTIDFLAKHKNSQPIWLSVMHSVVLDENGDIEKGIEIITDVTSKKSANLKLETLSVAASKSSSGVLIRTPQGEVIWMNDALEHILGYTLEEMEGRKFGEMLVGEETDYETFKYARERTAQNKPYNLEILIYDKLGEKKWIYLSNNPIFDDAGELNRQVSTVVDITERKSSEQQLKLLSLVASKTQNGVVINDKNSLITWVNDSFEQITGYSLEDVKGRRIGDVMKGEETDVEALERVRQLAADKKPYYIELLNYDKSGDAIWLAISNTPIFDQNGEIEQEIEIVNDITERKLAEEEMIRTREDALNLSKAKEAFLSVMSHEIRTPLNAVMGLTHILLDDAPTESQKENLEILKFSADNLLTLINDVLDFTKIETGNLVLEKTEINLKLLISKTLSSLQFKASEKNVILRSEIDHSIPDVLMGDNTRLYQIFMNLLGNSLKFTEKGEVKLKADVVKSTPRTVKIRFEVSDTGIGIAPENIDKIFHAYTQAEADTTRKYGGTGLGLTITQKLVELHNSSIKVESEVGKGTQFIFFIDFEKGLDSIKAVDMAPTDKKMENRILVVDDNQINRLLAKKVLTKWGAEVAEAADGMEAVEMVKNNSYDLILMDMNMPVMNGSDASRTIRSLGGKYYRDLPIIALTASMLKSELDMIHKSGMTDFVLKPFVPDNLYETIKKYI